MSGRPAGQDPADGSSEPQGGTPEVVVSQAEVSDAVLAERLRQLSQRIDAEKSVKQSQTVAARERDMTGFGKAMRLSADFIAGVVVGGGLGWAVDKWLGTMPWGMIVLLLLGFCAGVLNVMRTAGLAPQPGETGWQPKDGPPRS